MLVRAAVLAVTLLPSTWASAHSASDSYLTLQLGPPTPRLRWEIALRDLEVAVGLDSNADDHITWGELKRAQAVIAAYAAAHLSIEAGDVSCAVQLPRLRAAQRLERGYAVLDGTVECPDGQRPDNIHYALMFDQDPTHRGLLDLRLRNARHLQVLTEDDPAWRFTASGASMSETFARFWREGMWHVLIGLDHIAFLAVLLLPCAAGRGAARRAPRALLVDAARIVTAFTIAHSITLVLAVLDLVRLPDRLVESAIAFTVLLAAIDNLRGIFGAYRAQVAFALGLVHGLGFAGALQALDLPASGLGIALSAFNLGVECAQLVLVCVLLPVAWSWGSIAIRGRRLAPALAVVIGGIALVWLAERSLDMTIFSS